MYFSTWNSFLISCSLSRCTFFSRNRSRLTTYTIADKWCGISSKRSGFGFVWGYNLIKIRSLIRSRYTKCVWRERIKDLILIRLMGIYIYIHHQMSSFSFWLYWTLDCCGQHLVFKGQLNYVDSSMAPDTIETQSPFDVKVHPSPPSLAN